MNDSARITKDSLFSQPHANLYNLLNIRDNVPLPAGLPQGHKYVYTREPRTLSRNFNGYPCIIVEPPVLSLSEPKTVSNTKKTTTYEMTVRILAADNDSDSTGNPNGLAMMNMISDDIIKTLNANDTILRSYGMKNMELSGSYDWIDFEGKRVFSRELKLVFKQLQTVK